jgi:hypothetical protein
MNLQNKILPVALVAALLGGTVGAFVMRPKTNDLNTVASSNLLPASNGETSQAASLRYNETLPVANNETPGMMNVANTATGDDECYRAGFTGERYIPAFFSRGPCRRDRGCRGTACRRSVQFL